MILKSLIDRINFKVISCFPITLFLYLNFSLTKYLLKWIGRHQLQIHISTQVVDLCPYTVYIYIYVYGVDHSGEGMYGCRTYNAKLFEQIEHSGIREGIKCKQTNATAAAAT